MDDLFQRPLGPISIILNFPKKILVKAEIKKLSSKNEVLMKIEGIQAISVLLACFMVKPAWWFIREFRVVETVLY